MQKMVHDVLDVVAHGVVIMHPSSGLVSCIPEVTKRNEQRAFVTCSTHLHREY